ncbi:hypothetical protein BDP27DRAFT_1343315 [Rhodocollybia butyracea]|uniref:C2H2-type domain-containing protein n=1 Tax=Rhodocollybia butyracea TaxID=206335 RepID=A0A9P5TXT0_9AGAR|nr:hypothetical protein BDP27DRAFT_1343315 [Rhodocollybia butyracea]
MDNSSPYQDSFNSGVIEPDLEEFDYTVTIVSEDPRYPLQLETGPSQRDYNIDNGSPVFNGNSYPGFASFAPATVTAFPSATSMLNALNDLHLDTQDLQPSYNSTVVDQYDERDFLRPPTSPYYDLSPPTPYDGSEPFSASTEGEYPPSPSIFSDAAGSGHIGRGRSRSLSSPYHSAWRARSSSASRFTGPIGRGSGKNRESSVVSDNSSLEHINPLFLSSPVLTPTTPSLCSPTLYTSSLNGSVSSLVPSDSGREDEKAKYRANVATEKTQAASKKRRKKDPTFFCQELGCNQGFTAKHNLINHENSHKGFRPFVCVYCNDTFVTKSVMKRHAKKCPEKKAKAKANYNL